jgi:DNA-binding NtrC family response regulator
MDTILVATQDPQTNTAIRRILSPDDQIHMADSPDQIIKTIKTIACDCLFIDLSLMETLPGTPGHSTGPRARVQHLKDIRPLMAIIVIAGNNDVRNAVGYMKSGASNYITAPIDAHELRLVIDEISSERRRQSELTYLRERILEEDSLDIVNTLSPKMKKVYDNVMSVGPTKTTVLLLGETGTGKSFTAKLIHRHSNRKNGPFISVHCGAIPETLIESELFGHEKGSFTGAHRRKLGKFELASGGTIFMDEIGTISKSAQVKLLTVLQEGIYQRVGGEQTLTANVRVIAASNADLKQMCADDLFRKDLYYRLNVFPVTIPLLNRTQGRYPCVCARFPS